MDHHGLLILTRQVQTTLTGIRQVRPSNISEWNWHVRPVLYPESRCPFCLEVIRSNGIWFFTNPLWDKLIGMVLLEQGKRFELIQPSHPHDTGGGFLCLGKNDTGIELLASTPNLRDTPMGPLLIPRWLKRYWNRHTCEQSRAYIQEYATHSNHLLKELDKL